VFVRNELIPLQKRLEEVNNWLDSPIITFLPYEM
ncbi:TPA: phage portal protein, partial [Klebsiella pneumoniae]